VNKNKHYRLLACDLDYGILTWNVDNKAENKIFFITPYIKSLMSLIRKKNLRLLYYQKLSERPPAAVLPEAVRAAAWRRIDLNGRVGSAAGRLNLSLSVRA
jgi:hypothetical protein